MYTYISKYINKLMMEKEVIVIKIKLALVKL